MDTPNVPVDCASCARLREQVATLAHAAAGLREDAARARESERVATALCVSALGQTRRLWLRRERLARWAGVVAADTREREPAIAAVSLRCRYEQLALDHETLQLDAHDYRAAREAHISQIRALRARLRAVIAVLRGKRADGEVARWREAANEARASRQRQIQRAALIGSDLSRVARDLARVVAERDALRAAIEDAVRDLARSWRSA